MMDVSTNGRRPIECRYVAALIAYATTKRVVRDSVMSANTVLITPAVTPTPSYLLLRSFVRWGLYPLSWACLLGLNHLAHTSSLALREAWVLLIVILLLLYCVVERWVPYRQRWSMTRRSFLADLQYLVGNGVFISVTSSALALWGISMSEQSVGSASQWPLLLQLVVCLLMFEALQYGLHRATHEARGRVGRFLWNIHVAHHLPNKVYIVMHVAGHPLYQLLMQSVVIILPIWLMGYDQSVVVFFLMMNSMHGLISHINADVRMGWMNYVFVGPEQHRFHHSADINEAKNYGIVLSVYDQLGGTFEYHSQRIPKALGVHNALQYPSYKNIWQVWKLPFIRYVVGDSESIITQEITVPEKQPRKYDSKKPNKHNSMKNCN